MFKILVLDTIRRKRFAISVSGAAEEMRHRRQINETGPVESRFLSRIPSENASLPWMYRIHEAKNRFFHDDIETKSVDPRPYIPTAKTKPSFQEKRPFREKFKKVKRD